jgi:hypothetical protein
MPVIQSEIPPVGDSGQDIHFMLNEHERVQNSMGRLIGKYVSDEEGLGIPTYLARFDHDAKRLVATEPEAAKSKR